jgi:putative nucleotidyltransferase with HDIG domain
MDLEDKARILIVDDDQNAQKILKLIFEKREYSVESAFTGSEALSFARDRAFNLALLDIRLPDMDGVALVATLKELQPDIEVVMVTGFASIETAVRALNEGARAYITKPFNMEDVLAKAKDLIERQSLVREKRRAEESLRQKNAEIHLLYEAGKQLGSTLDLDTIYRSVLEAISKVMSCDGLFISSYDPDAKLIHCLAGWGETGQAMDVSQLPPIPLEEEGKGTQSLVIHTGESLYLSDYQKHFATAQTKFYVRQNGGVAQEEEQPADGNVPRSALIVPLKLEGSVIGVIQVFSYRLDGYTEDNLRFLEALTPQVAAAIANAKLFQQAQEEIAQRKQAEEALRKSADNFSTLYETALDLSGKNELSSLLTVLVERAARMLKTNYGCIYLYDAQREELVLNASKGLETLVGTRLKLGEGMAGRVAQTLAPLIVENYSTWEHRSIQYNDAHFSSSLQVPVSFGGEFIGVLAVNETVPVIRDFSEADVLLLSLYASLAAGAVHSANLYQEVKQFAEQLSMLYDVGLALNSMLEPRALLEYLFRTAMGMLGADRAEFYRFESSRGEIAFELALGYDDDRSEIMKQIHFSLEDDRGLLGWVIRNRSPINIPDLQADERYVTIDPTLCSGLWTPVLRDYLPLGVLSVFSQRKDAFTPEHERLLSLFANQAAVALENAHLLEEIQRRLHQVQALRKIDEAIADMPDLDHTLNTFIEQVIEQLEVDAADVYLLDEENRVFRYAAGRGFHRQDLEGSTLGMDQGLIGHVAVERKLVKLYDVQEFQPKSSRSDIFKSEEFMAYYGVPLVAKDEVNGILEIYFRASITPDREWFDFLEALAKQAAIAIDSVNLFDDLQQANLDLTIAYDATLEGWVRALDLRDKETEGHTLRVAQLTVALARAMGMDEAELVQVRRGALLHDIGKIGVPDRILHKPGPLDDEEWKVMRQHPSLAYELLSPIRYLHKALEIPYCHHEKWDGNGYPRGLKGEEIPFSARIFAVIDVWDALRSDRPYRKAWTVEQARAYIQEQAGIYFDPQIVEVCIKRLNELIQ